MGLNVLGCQSRLLQQCNVFILPMVIKDRPLSPRFSPYVWLDFTNSRHHAAFRYGRKNTNYGFHKKNRTHTISALTGIRGYLLDHSGGILLTC